MEDWPCFKNFCIVLLSEDVKLFIIIAGILNCKTSFEKEKKRDSGMVDDKIVM